MDSCEHVENVRPSRNHSILRPQKWLCSVCGTTESVYACLSCAHVACGRFNEEHSLLHYTKTKHPLAIEVNRKHVYCYDCDDYVLNDNSYGDLEQLRSALSAIATQSFQDIPADERPLLRSFSLHEDWSEANQVEDKLRTAETCRRTLLLRRTFRQWVRLIADGRNRESPQRKHRRLSEPCPAVSLPSLVRKPTLTPGVTGLRNLGNTCYMNAILQVLSHIEQFRSFFHHLLPASDFSPWSSPYKRTPSSAPSPASSPGRDLMRQNTMELFQHLSQPETSPQRLASSKVGLAGGRETGCTSKGIAKRRLLQAKMDGTDDTSNVSLCVELHALFRVLWSGKWAQVSPHALLQAIWTLIPDFRGYSQQDAQEFLCELLDKVQQELTAEESLAPPDIVSSVFEGKLTSQVTCERCGHQSRTTETFLDLSLEFPDRYQVSGPNWSGPRGPCHITDMLKKFTAVEQLERESYECEQCNGKRRRVSKIAPTLTDANKQLLVSELPDILRLHLKRFRWSGRYHREKIMTHVTFEERLSMADYSTELDGTEYRLTGVTVHHGTGFACGHYTAFTWNTSAGSWVCCNDSRMELCPLETVCGSQAYILFYSRVRPGEDNSDLATPLVSYTCDSDGEVTFKSQSSEPNSTVQIVSHR